MPAPAPLSRRARRLRFALAAGLALLLLVTAVTAVTVRTPNRDAPGFAVSAAATAGVEVQRFRIDSAATGKTRTQTVVLPRGKLAGRPLLVFLPGKGQKPTAIAAAPMQAAVAKLGARAPVVVLPVDDGGSYWHDRQSGRWARYVLREVIPQTIARYGLDDRRVAIGGISMGGAGAYGLAQRAPGRFCAVGGHSAALWTQAGASAPGAYDDARDFRRNDPVGPVRRGRFRYRVPLWLDNGRSDPFAAANRTFAGALKRNGEQLTRSVPAGGHQGAYWHRNMERYLRFYARALARCSA